MREKFEKSSHYCDTFESKEKGTLSINFQYTEIVPNSIIRGYKIYAVSCVRHEILENLLCAMKVLMCNILSTIGILQLVTNNDV